MINGNNERGCVGGGGYCVCVMVGKCNRKRVVIE